MEVSVKTEWTELIRNLIVVISAQFSENPGEVMEQVITCYNVPTDKQVRE